MTAACYDVEIRHQRADPFDYGFAFRSRIWLVDLADVPSLPRGLGWLCRFDDVDRLTGWLSRHGVPAPDRILMLANPRVLGYVFNPLTVFYCLDTVGALTHVVAEVRNTYGGRHRYLLRPDGRGAARVDKAFYVSPFYPVDGSYRLRLPLPDERLLVSVSLHRPGQRPFSAVMTGTCRPAAARLWTALRTPLATRAIMFGIKRHGIALYAKGLRIVPRPADHPPAADHPPPADHPQARCQP
ncbi:MAG: DUF1365 domain-containing protein [Jatrophihabitantaceae bacterium]